MKFSRVISDAKWRVANDCTASAESCPDHERVMPPIACPVCGNKTRDTRNPGFFYPAANVERFPPSLRNKLDYGTVLDPGEWEALRKAVISCLPYEVPISPCTLFGPGTIEVRGLFPDCYPGVICGHGRFMISKTALERLRAKGISDLFAVPVKVLSRRKAPDVFFELQIEHSALLSGSLDRSKIVAELREINTDWARKQVLVCDRCGREDGRLPKRIVLVGSSIAEGASLFRLTQRPYNIFCTEHFSQAVKELELTNILLEPVKTDGSEKTRGFAQVQPARPELWDIKLATAAAKPVVRKTPAAKKPLRIPSAPPLEKLLLRGPLRAKASALTKLVRPTIRFALHPDPSIQIGQSRFGGLPDLPKGLGWPGRHGTQLDFLSQLSLGELQRVLPDSPLPRTGWLWFFYDTENLPWGREPEDRKGWEVVFWNGPANDLRRAAPPEWFAEDAALPVCSLSMQKTEWLPDHTAPCVNSLKLSEVEMTAYRAALKKARGPGDNPIHKLLGWPDTIQNDMAEDCSKLAGGRDWQLLLQLDSEENAGMTWGDGGRLYFWIRKRDLVAQRFDRCWVVVQSY